jgi:hypothetical protein
MVNFYEAIRANPNYNKLEIGDFLFAEYTCGVTAEKLGFWTDTDYLLHVVTGAKTWHMPDGIFRANPGETLFIKKGANIVEQHFEKGRLPPDVFYPGLAGAQLGAGVERQSGGPDAGCGNYQDRRARGA